LDKHVAHDQGRADSGSIDFGHTLEDEEDEDGDGSSEGMRMLSADSDIITVDFAGS